MYVTPRPKTEDDPLYPVRLALMPIIGLVLGIWLNSPMAMVYPSLLYSLLASGRMAFDAGRVIASPIVFGGALWLVSGLVVMLQGVPLVLIAAMGLLYVLAFYMIQRTGSGFGMLIAVAGVLMSVMGLGSYQAMDYLRVEMTKAALCSAIVIPVLYALLPPRTTKKMPDEAMPTHSDQLLKRSLIRGLTLLVFSGYLYTILDMSNVMLAVAAMFVLVFPTRRSLWAEAGQRSFSVLLGGAMAMGVLGLLTISSHFVVLVAAMFLATLWVGHKMMYGRMPSMAYQDAGSVMISLVGSALATAEPGFAYMQRLGLTILGTIVAAFAVSLLEALLLKPAPLVQPVGADA